MNIKSILENEKINVIRELNKKEIGIIAKDISIKLCLAFPEHNLSRKDLSFALSQVKMYIADLPRDFSGAKYIIELNSIYFNKNLPFEKIPDTAMHECIHFIQNYYSNKNLGLVSSLGGLALNEAAVQLMASEANMSGKCNVKYFDISLNTISPNYYPLECVLVNEIAYFTGTYPLYHSVLYSNDIFKNTFEKKFNHKMYSKVSKKLDLLLNLENEISSYSEELSFSTKKHEFKELNKIINLKKHQIMNLFFHTQNYIIKHCFNYEFRAIRTLEDIHNFKNKLYNFQNIMGYNDNYYFYNDFYCNMMNALEDKKEQILKLGALNFVSQNSTALMIIDNKTSFAKNLFKKLKKLFKSKSSIDYINE